MSVELQLYSGDFKITYRSSPIIITANKYFKINQQNVVFMIIGYDVNAQRLNFEHNL